MEGGGDEGSLIKRKKYIVSMLVIIEWKIRPRGGVGQRRSSKGQVEEERNIKLQ